MSKQIRSSKAGPSRRTVLAGLLAVAGACAFALPRPALAADPLDAPRDAGTVGEGANGYAIPREGATAETRALVDDINARRRAFYQQKAEEQGVSMNAIQEIYAKVIYDKAPSGWWFRSESGNWVRK